MSANQPGAGPPLRTPVFTINLLGKNIQLFFEKPWITWLNQIQSAVDNQEDLALLADRGSSAGALSDQSLEVASPPTARFTDSDALLITDRQAQIEDIADRVLALIPTRDDAGRLIAELLQLLAPPGQRNWVDYVMRESGGAVKFEGETVAFPALRRSTTTPADTQSVLADKSALTGHEVLDEAYGVDWDSKIEVPTKNAIYDLIPIEGTWTPGVSFGGGVVGITYSNQLGRYQVIGNFVLFAGSFNMTSKGSSAGAALITGLPFNSKNENLNAGVAIAMTNMNATAGGFQAFQLNNNNKIEPFYTNVGTPSQLDDTNFTNTSNVFVSGIYRRA